MSSHKVVLLSVKSLEKDFSKHVIVYIYSCSQRSSSELFLLPIKGRKTSRTSCHWDKAHPSLHLLFFSGPSLRSSRIPFFFLTFYFALGYAVELLSCVQLFAAARTMARRLLCPWDFPGKNTRVGCHALLQAVFLTAFLTSPALVSGFLTTTATWEAHMLCCNCWAREPQLESNPNLREALVPKLRPKAATNK